MKPFDELNRLLDYMEENIDLAHIHDVQALQYAAMKHQAVPYLPLTMRITPDGYQQIPLEDAYNVPEYMLYNELLWSTMHSSYNSVRTQDDCPLMIRANHGIGIIASMFGCKSSIFNNTMPWVEHLDWDVAVRQITSGVPALDAGLAGQVVDTYHYYIDRLKDYPKCAQSIHLTQPDLQGPFDILHLIVGAQAFYSLYDEPALAHELLDVISQTYVDFRKHLSPLLSATVPQGDGCYVHGFTVGGQVLLKCDTATANLSAQMCKAYEVDFCQKILDAFAEDGGGSIHACGEMRDDVMQQLLTTSMCSFNFGNPEKHDIQKIYPLLQEKQVSIVGWGFNRFYDEYHATGALDGIKTGMSLMAKARNVEEAKAFLAQHRAIRG